jgi:hypothetical protein
MVCNKDTRADYYVLDEPLIARDDVMPRKVQAAGSASQPTGSSCLTLRSEA